MTSGLVWSGLVWSAAEKIEGGKGQRDGEQERDKSTRSEKYVSFSVFLKKQRSAGKPQVKTDVMEALWQCCDGNPGRACLNRWLM